MKWFPDLFRKLEEVIRLPAASLSGEFPLRIPAFMKRRGEASPSVKKSFVSDD